MLLTIVVRPLTYGFAAVRGARIKEDRAGIRLRSVSARSSIQLSCTSGGQARPIGGRSSFDLRIAITGIVASRAALIISVKLHVRIVNRRLSDINALSAAHREKAKAYELHARRCDEQSRRTEVRDLLTPVYGWWSFSAHRQIST